MKTRTVILPIVLVSIVILLNSCASTMAVTVGQSTSLSKKTPVTLVIDNDPHGLGAEIEHQLFSHGYKMMSYSAAKKALNVDTNYGSGAVNTEITKTTTLNSIYCIEVMYTSIWDLFFWACSSFSARITDLSTGELIMTASFRGESGFRAVAEQLVMKMDDHFK